MVLLLAATAQIIKTGCLNAVGTEATGDLRAVYGSARAMLFGKNAYDDPHTLRGILLEAGAGDILQSAVWPSTPPVYPPSTFAVVLPLAALGWPAAQVAWLVIGLSSIVLIAYGAVTIAGLRAASLGGVLLMGVVLNLRTLPFGISTGNAALPATALLIGGLCADARGRSGLAIALVVLAACLKPQVGGLVIGYWLVTRRWGVVGVAAGIVLLIAAVGMWRLQATAPGWLADWRAVLGRAVGPGGINDPFATNPARFRMLNLQVPFGELLQPRAAHAAAAAVATCLVAIWAFLGWKNPHPRRDAPLIVGALGVVACLPIYHTVGDLLLLTILVAWSVRELRAAPSRKYVLWVFVGVAVFFVPSQAVVAAVSHRWPAVESSPAWNALVLARFSCVTLALAVILLFVMARRNLERESDGISGKWIEPA